MDILAGFEFASLAGEFEAFLLSLLLRARFVGCEGK